MDYKDFRNGLLSLSSVLALFSITLLISSIALKPFLGLEPVDRDLIVIIDGINILFSAYCLIEGLYIKNIFKLEEKNIRKFGKRIGIISILYFPNIIVFCSLFIKELHSLLTMMFFLLLLIKVLLLGIIFKEVYDLVLRNPTDRKFELEQNRKLYFE